MKIELKNIHHSERLSQETNAYSADVWIDGKPFAEVSNDGWGGCDMQNPHKKSEFVTITKDSVQIDATGFQKRLDEVNAWLKANNEATTHELGNGRTFTMEVDLEAFCGQQLDKFIATKWAKGQLSRNVLIKHDGKIMTLSFRRGVPKARKIEVAVEKYGEANVLNCMKKEDAIALLVAA